jgi:hypothetical protein
MKSVVMDIVVANVPPKFGMLLSRYWIKMLRGTLQMDLTYVTISVFGGEHKRLYREAQLAYIISKAYPTNHPIFSLILIWDPACCSSPTPLRLLFN